MRKYLTFSLLLFLPQLACASVLLDVGWSEVGFPVGLKTMTETDVGLSHDVDHGAIEIIEYKSISLGFIETSQVDRASNPDPNITDLIAVIGCGHIHEPGAYQHPEVGWRS